MGNDWLLVCFTALVLTGAGITVAVAAGESRNPALKLQTGASLVALLVLAVGGGFAVMHLGRPAMIFGALGNPTTGIFREFVTFGLTTVAIVAYLIALLRGAEASTTLWLSRFAAVAAVLLSLAVGSAFVMPWRLAWDTWTLVLPYIGWVLWSAAFAATMLLGLADEKAPGDHRIYIVASAIFVVSLVIYLIGTVISGGMDAALQRVLMGDLALVFWGSIVIGFLMPLALAHFIKGALIGSFISMLLIMLGTGLFQWVIQLLGTPVWHFFAR